MKAREVVVLGTIHGNVETSDKIDIRKDAKLVGDIKTARIGIEDGAYFKGNIDIVRPEAPVPPRPPRKPAAAPCRPTPAPRLAACDGGPGAGGRGSSAKVLGDGSKRESGWRHETATVWNNSARRWRSVPGLSILDLAAANQQTVSFVTELRPPHLFGRFRPFQLDHCFGPTGTATFYENQSNPRKVEHFLESVAAVSRRASFDGALVWDCAASTLTPSLLDDCAVERLHRDRCARESSLLAVFPYGREAGAVPTYSFRIQDHRTLLLAPRGPRRPSQVFNNRSLEKLFQDFQSVKVLSDARPAARSDRTALCQVRRNPTLRDRLLCPRHCGHGSFVR